MIDVINQMLRPLANKIRSLATRGVLKIIDDDKVIQYVQVTLLKGEVRDKIPRLQDYGFTSVPHPGADCVYLSLNGNRRSGVVIKADNREYRLKGLASGEVAIYTDEGDLIHLKRGGNIEIKGSSKVYVDSPNIELGQGGLEKILNGETFQAFFNNHTHLGNLGVPTGKPMTPSPASHLSNTVKART